MASAVAKADTRSAPEAFGYAARGKARQPSGRDAPIEVPAGEARGLRFALWGFLGVMLFIGLLSVPSGAQTGPPAPASPMHAASTGYVQRNELLVILPHSPPR